MSTRKDQFEDRQSALSQGFEGSDTPDDIEIPSCTIEDVDRSVFNLFDKQLPFQAKNKEGAKKIPVIFATGERFAVLRRKEALRDKKGALILPLVSIMRTGIEQDVSHGTGPGQNGPITIHKRLSKESSLYKRLVNQHRLKNQDNVAHQSNQLNPDGAGTEPGSIGTRRLPLSRTQDSRDGKLLTTKLGENIYETITMPPVKFYTATYDVTLWSQYTQEMNDMLMTIMSLYQNNHQRTFKLETDKGYWFVGFVASPLTPDNNADDFTDDERLIRYSLEIKVAGYVIAPDYPGAPSYIRRSVSAPMISFETVQTFGNAQSSGKGIPTITPDMSLLKDLYSEFDPVPTQEVGIPPTNQMLNRLNEALPGSGAETASIGGQTTGGSPAAGTTIIKTTTDIFTGEKTNKVIKIKGSNQRKGETVLREELAIDLGDLFDSK